MSVIWYDSIQDVLIGLSDPNTWWKTYEVPWISTTKIDGATSISNINISWSDGIAWWSTDIGWSASDYNTVAWTSGWIYLPDWTAISVSSGNTGNMSTTTYIYYDASTASVQTTTTPQNSVWEWKILLCVAWPTQSWKDAQYQAFWTNAQSTFITADNIAANTIAANELVWNTISWRTIEWCTLRAYYWSGASLDEIKIWTDGTQPKIQIKDNNTIVGVINWWSISTWDNTVNAIVMWGATSYVWLVGNVVCTNKFKLPVGSNLYFS